ncbi:Ig-like domain-containing protein, partial [Citrobacter braakii]|uniref:Ig-like domain-containing protein n=1 Tax=Citrobacter braakii TaxID=57706 RepID=UPI0024E07256
NGASIAATGITGADGSVTVTLTSTTVGLSTVTATVNSSNQSVDTHFIADTASAILSSISTVSDNAVANGTATNSVKAVVQDAYSNPLSGMTVRFSADNGASIAATGITGADGSVTVTLTSTTAGLSTVTALLNNSNQRVDTHFIADTASAYLSSIDRVSDDAAANGTATNSVKAVVLDAKRNPVSGATVEFSATNGASIAATGITGADGSVTVTLTSTTVGLSWVTAKLLNSTSQIITQSHFIADTATATLSSLAIFTNNAVANGTDTNSVRAVVKDAYGHPVSGVTVKFSADNGASIAATGITGLVNGSVVVTLTSTTAGLSTVTATVNSSTASQAVNFRQ